MLGQLTGEDQTDTGLDLSGGDGRLLVVGSQLRGLGGNTLEDILSQVRMKLNLPICICGRHTVDERVQDGHGTVGDTSVGVDLLENYSQLESIVQYHY